VYSPLGHASGAGRRNRSWACRGAERGNPDLTLAYTFRGTFSIKGLQIWDFPKTPKSHLGRNKRTKADFVLVVVRLLATIHYPRRFPAASLVRLGPRI
jgi:hypothetical protein